MFDIPLLGRAIAKLLFSTSRRIGILFIDRLLAQDDPADLEALLHTVAIAMPGAGVTAPVIKDRSPKARSGPSLALIAFACITVSFGCVAQYHLVELIAILVQMNHALERLKNPGKRIEFAESHYNALWSNYVRELASHPQLGKLRSSFLDCIKYVQFSSHSCDEHRMLIHLSGTSIVDSARVEPSHGELTTPGR